MTDPGVAIIGMACSYPEAASPDELWENVLSQRRSFRRIPPERLRLADYHSADRRAPDMFGTEHAAVLEDYVFDRVAFRIGGSAFRSTDTTHWLALDIASRALADAGLADPAADLRDRTGVIVGNTLTGEFSRANTLRLRWPYVRHLVGAALSRADWPSGERREFLDDLERDFKRPFPAANEDTLAGSLSNTIAGRICNIHDFHGGGYTVDGACASSLLAVINGTSLVASGELDVAIVGGVDLSIDPFELVGFAKTNALATDLMRVYDVRSEGFWPGEGCGFLVLARQEDAARWGVAVHAVIKGWGVSSDGSGGLTRPEVAGQLLALRRAYDRAGYSIASVPMFEGHGTGTQVGDAVEISALAQAVRETRSADHDAQLPTGPAALSSVKANIGHTKAAAGVAGLIKAIMSVRSGVLPPATGCETPRPELTRNAAEIAVLPAPAPWPADRPRRAGVSAMGFGGINTHVTIERPPDTRSSSAWYVEPTRQQTLATTFQDAELIPLSAASRTELVDELTTLQAAAAALSFGDLRDLAIRQCARGIAGPFRAAVVASRPAELATRLSQVLGRLRLGERTLLEPGAYLGIGEQTPKIGLLFPGQGAPVRRDGGAMGRRFPAMARFIDAADLPVSADQRDTLVAQPAIVAASLGALAVLDELGISGCAAVGHSVGELAALSWAGVFSAAAAVDIARVRGAAMAALPGERGSMAELAMEEAEVRALIGDLPVVIAADNDARRQVIAGPSEAVTSVVARARAHDARATALPVSHAFHSPLVAAAADPLLRHISEVEIGLPARSVISTVTGAELTEDTDIARLLASQVTAPVRFRPAWERLGVLADLVIEVGPGEILTGLAGQEKLPVIAVDAGGPSLRGLLEAVGAAYALGAPVRLTRLAAERVARSDDPLRPRSFLANPCEQVDACDLVVDDREPVLPEETTESVEPVSGDALTVVRDLVAERAELPVEVVTATSSLLGDLRLNSITIAEIATAAAGKLGVVAPILPTEASGGTLGELADYLAGLAPADETTVSDQADGVGPWLAPFTVCWRPDQADRSAGRPFDWQVLAPQGHPWELGVTTAFRDGDARPGAGNGLVICAPRERSLAGAQWLLGTVQRALRDNTVERIAVLHNGIAGALIRTLALEHPRLDIRLLEIPSTEDIELLALARAEAEGGGTGFAEVSIGEDHRRLVPALEPCSLAAGPSWLTADDVLLVTGGGKGIGAECALALAESSGAALAVLGRADPAVDADLAANLERLRGVADRFCYVRADIRDAELTRAAVSAVTRQLGPVTAIVHAAGNNQPQPLDRLDEDALRAAIEPKVDGLRNLLSATNEAELRLLVGFGSIIARMGLPGEGHYALANDWLAQEVADAAARLPGCRCATVEWSVWAGTGMGERLGSIDILARAGVSPISPDDGIDLLRRLVDAVQPPATIVATGRFGNPPTLSVRRAELPMLRFLERPRVQYPGIELVCDAVLGAGTDPWLADHTLDGTPLFPAAMGLEAMAQAAGVLAAPGAATCPVPVAMTDVELLRPITVPADGSRTIRLAALRRDPGCFDVVIRSDETGFAADHFRCTVRYDDPGDPHPIEVPGGATVSLDVGTDLYGPLLFHGPAFRRVSGFGALHAWWSKAQVDADADRSWFSEYLPQHLVLGDPGCRDAIIHAEQACVPHRRCLPSRIERITFARPPTGRVTVSARQRRSDEQTLTFDLTVRGETGSTCEQWHGMTLRMVAPLATPQSWTPALLVPYLERRAAELGVGSPGELTVAVTAADTVDTSGRRDKTASALSYALGLPPALRYRPDGRPETGEAAAVSSAHADRFTFAVAGQAPLACDAEVITERSVPAWGDLLGEARLRLAELVATECGESIDTAATRVWVVGECLSKAGRLTSQRPALHSAEPGGWAVFVAGRLRIATYVARLTGQRQPTVFGLLREETT